MAPVLPCLLALLAQALPAASPPPARTAAQYIARTWGTGDGLPQNTVTAIVQTRDGYLWLGTFGGLVRFDGHAFTVFNPANSPGLASGRVVKLLEDRRGVLWIGTEAGLAKYEAGRFTTYRTSDGLPHDEVTALLDDKDGRLWIATVGGLARFDGGRFQRVPAGALAGVGQSIAQTGDGDVWVATGQGVGRFRDSSEPTIVDRESSTALLTDSKGRLWIGGDGLRLWDPAADSGRGGFTPVSLPGPFAARGIVTAIAEDRAGTLWICTAVGGVYSWRDGSFAAHTIADGLSENVTKAVAPDSDGNLWIGTNVGGLNRLKRRRVFSYPNATGAAYSIAPIVDDGADGLWMGEICGGVKHFRAGRFEPFAGQHDIPQCVWALHRDPDGTLWIGGTGSGLGRLRDGRYTSYRTDPDSRRNLVTAIARDREGVLWIGSDAGLSRFDNGTLTDYGREAGLDQRVLTIYQDRGGALWVGTIKGLFRFAGGHVTRYSKEQGLSHDLVRAIHEDADGVLWIGTYGGGLNRLENGRFVSYGIEEGLPDVAVSRIIEDPQGYLWMSGNKGVFRVARSQLNEFAKGRLSSVTGVTYGMADGMVIDETNGGQPAGWRTADGRLWFPTIKGLISIEPELGGATPPRVVVEQSVVNGRATPVGSLASLGPGGVDVEFHYTAIDLGAGEKTRFRYRLAGYDDKWIDSGTRRVAYYTKISPGGYHFEVMSTDADGAWSTTPARIAVVVIPHWWQRREAIVAGLLLLVAITSVTVRHLSLRRARARVAELEREQAIERERSRIARDLHDDLGSRLAQIALIAEQSADGARVSNVAREAMRTMDELVWTVNARNDTVEKLAEFAAEFAEEHLTLAGVRYRLQIQPDLEGRRLDADIRRHLFLAFKEAIHNLVKHAGASEVRIALGVEGGTLSLEVSDNGRGLPPGAAAGTGNGLLNMRERMTAAGGTVDFGPADGGGTRIVFRAPVSGEAAAGAS